MKHELKTGEVHFYRLNRWSRCLWFYTYVNNTQNVSKTFYMRRF